MANKEAKAEGNVDGKYYVDDQCTACGVCEAEAPENFKMSDDGSTAIVSKQPEGDEETAACEAAIESCPAECIGNDGE